MKCPGKAQGSVTEALFKEFLQSQRNDDTGQLLALDRLTFERQKWAQRSKKKKNCPEPLNF